jgi:cell division protein ZipA
MPDLQRALIGIGLLFLAGLALWEWRRARRAPGRKRLPETALADITLTTERPRRIEPDLGDVVGVFVPHPEDTLEVPSILTEDLLTESVPVAHDTAVDVPSTARGASGEIIAGHGPAATTSTTSTVLKLAVPICWPPAQSEQVLALRVVRLDGAALPGRMLRTALEAAGLVHGPQSIYHRADANGAVIVSAANLVHPGTLVPEQMDATEYRGLSLFSVLPGPLPPVRMLEELVATARSVAHRLGAIVQDEKGGNLDGQRLIELRRALPEATRGAAGTADGSAS